MTFRVPLVAALILGLLTGCTPGPSQFEAPIEVKGQVVLPDGKPVTDVKLTFNPMESGLPVSPKLDKQGRFTASVIPGKYNYVFEPLDGKPVAVFKQVPEKYHTPHTDHVVRFEPGQDIAITLR